MLVMHKLRHQIGLHCSLDESKIELYFIVLKLFNQLYQTNNEGKSDANSKGNTVSVQRTVRQTF